MTALNLVEHSRVLLAHLYAKREAITSAIASVEALVGEHPELLDRAAPPVAARPAPVPPAPRPPKRQQPPGPAEAAPLPSPATGPLRETRPPEPSPATRAAGGRAKPGDYDHRVLVAVRDAGDLGITLTDACRAVVGPGRPQEVQRLAGTMKGVLDRLVKTQALVRDGRYYKRPPTEED